MLLLIHTLSLVTSEQRCLSPNKDAACHQAHLPWGCPVPRTLPSCCTASCDVEIPTFCPLRCRNQGGWMGQWWGGGGNRSISAAGNGKIHSLIERSCLGQEGSESAGFPELLESTAFSKAWLGKDQHSCWRQLSIRLGSRLLGMCSGLGDHLLMFPAIDQQALASTLRTPGLSQMWREATSVSNKSVTNRSLYSLHA